MKNNNFLGLTSLVAHSLFTGGCLVVLFVLVPFWQHNSADEFLSWFSVNSPNIAMIMLPLELIPLLLSIVTCYLAYRQKDEIRKWWLLNLLSNTTILILFFIYFRPANSSMSSGSIALEEVANELIQWERFHIARTAFTFLSVLFCFFGLKK